VKRINMRHEQDREAKRMEEGAERFHELLSPERAERFTDNKPVKALKNSWRLRAQSGLDHTRLSHDIVTKRPETMPIQR
jgi:hypothetical protein